jgi:hypothetical protein
VSLPSIFSLSPDSTEKLKDAELIRASTAAGSSQQPELLLTPEEVDQELAAAGLPPGLDLASISTSNTKTEIKTILVETTQVIEKK